MNQYSNFQLEHPLSVRKKFWKKLIDKAILNFFLSLIFGLAIAYVGYFVIVNTSESGSAFIGVLIFAIPIAFLIINIIYGIYVKAYIKRYYYDCGDKFITIKKGVFAPTEIHVQYPKIQDVYVDQDILDRIMGLYDVHIASATVTSGIEAHIDGVSVEVAESIKNIILNKILTESGGTNSVNSNPQIPLTPSDQSVNFSEKISSSNYPIISSWVLSSIISIIVSSFLWTAMLLLIFLGKIESISATGVFPYAVLLFVAMLIWRIIYLFIWKSNYYFEFTPEFILLRTGVISRQENHLPYKSIQNISTSQGIIERLFGLAKVSIENAASVLVDARRGTRVQSGISIVGQSLQKAEYINQILNKVVVSVKNSSSMGL